MKTFKDYIFIEPVPMPDHLEVFRGKTVTGHTPHQLWVAIQKGELIYEDIGNFVGSLHDPITEETCYVFFDECEQMSMPYESEAVAREAMAAYIVNLTGLTHASN